MKIKKTTGIIGIIGIVLAVGLISYITNANENYDPGISDDYSGIADISHFKKWGVYNVHDPSCIKWGNYYYAFSTDAIWRSPDSKNDTSIKIGNIQVRRSTDLVHWEFVGWVFDSIPYEARSWVEFASGGRKPNGIWAPYVLKYKNECRLYYSVSIFGANTSFIGLAIASSPEGPWRNIGCVVKTSATDAMNAIDPTVAVDANNGRQWLIYGSYFGGIYGLELEPSTGLAKIPNDKGHLIARRAKSNERVIEAPEVIYNPEQKKYFLFVSYDALFTHYNVRVGRSDNPEGPYFDYFGQNMADTTNNYPVLTYAYRFSQHPGWAGVGHCSVIRDGSNYFMLHQGRLAPDNHMMVLHVRKIYWTPDGWPVVSPERFASLPPKNIKKRQLQGSWEIITLSEIADSSKLWQGQIRWGGWKYDTSLFNNYRRVEFVENGPIKNWAPYTKWNFKNNRLEIVGEKDTLQLIIDHEWDWERKNPTIIFTGLNKHGITIWGKKI
ncbi:MAG: arabinan endo-1,5-alpha-L-arabinosidase [Bacteroidales bacterium]|nr:arabinan endo-1,5-alpha-L-arabinosidase [Bacteroidales bacterium]